MSTFDVENFVYKYFADIIVSTNNKDEREFRVDCINGCNDKKFYINAATGRAQCFKCGLKFNSLFKTIQGVTGADNAEVFKMIKDGELLSPSASFESFELRVLSKLYPLRQQGAACKLPEEAEPVSGNSSYIARQAIKWLTGRGLSRKDITHYGIQVCATGRYKNRVILPVYKDGELVYYNARAMGKAEVKVMNPPKDEDFIGKSELVFNIDRASQYKTGVLVEGFFDAVVGGPNFMAIMGKFLSEAQLYQILLAEFEEIVVMFDPDAHDWCLKAADTLNKFIPTKVVLLADKDPADLGREACWAEILQAPYYDWRMKLNLAV